jgi:hypothetical protein
MLIVSDLSFAALTIRKHLIDAWEQYSRPRTARLVVKTFRAPMKCASP